MKLLRSSAIALVLAGTAISMPARAADSELTVFDWAGFEEPAIWQGYVDKNGDAPTFALYGDDDEAYQKLASGFKADVAHPCDARDDGQEDHRSDDHLHQLDEGVAQRLQALAEGRPEVADGPAQHDGDQHLEIKMPIEGAARNGRRL